MVVFDGHEYLTEEEKRLSQDRKREKYWKKWGPYVAERQWATVREDYSPDGDAWSHFSHEHSRSRAYRWGEDGISGVCDTHGFQNIAFAFWNEEDDFLKERLFGLSNPQGNHGEGVKEAHFHVDNTPVNRKLETFPPMWRRQAHTSQHSYMKFLYKYPQKKFPYEDLLAENARRGKADNEYQIIDTGVFDEDRYWDIFIETAKESDDPDELLFRVTAWNRGPDPAPIHIVPHMWFRNTWAWGREPEDKKPSLGIHGENQVKSKHHSLGERFLSMSPSPAIRNSQWKHMHCDDILSMPDSWEYPFFAAWDSAFHCIPLAMIDPDFAKKQLDLFTREWYCHPNGQLPAYEWNFGDVNPPVHAWATFRTFKIERKLYGRQDLDFLERVFQKLLLNFTWWVNRKDSEGKNVFEGGFLGLDNIGLFNRSEPLPTGGSLEQADSTGWMAFYCLSMLNIALELAKHRRTYEDIASKFFEHFIFISDAMTFRTGDKDEKSLWNDEDGFYYDAISWGGPWIQQLPVRSLVGLIPLYATMTLEPELINKLPSFKKRVDWFIENRPDMAERNMASLQKRGKGNRILLSIVSKDRLEKILHRMLDEDEFFSEHGIRSLSKYHKENPFSMDVNGQKFSVGYVPGDSDSGLFGGNSNWRGPIWLCVNFLLVESLQRFFLFYGHEFQVECPTGSGDYMHLGHVSEEIQHRLQHLMTRNDDGRRSINDGNDLLDFDPHWRDYLWFYEFFDGDSGRGLGATHQCGWTGLMARMIHDTGTNCRLPHTPRTPSVGMAHYFDDVFTRNTGRRGSVHSIRGIRRSSTARSIDARSDFDNDINGDDSLGNSTHDLERERETAEADQHMHQYINSQLERFRDDKGGATDSQHDEYEATP
ncbi:hypothetical protein BN1708_012332 [Verticillium longisporum]|uniref:Mannosyl-oligosaccharide glucosidase n=1 Tax=Verticillium longisporum TaxID=100787 RepID=A0A0G4L8Z3_VERLO|nr:hypothetical protein BN1708_012332 [Verticillium longisporum]